FLSNQSELRGKGESSIVNIPNYRDFYSNSPILINEKDWRLLQQDEKYKNLFANRTHWLIAMEGSARQGERFEWRIVVFPSEKSGFFHYDMPFFQSDYFQTFDEASQY